MQASGKIKEAYSNQYNKSMSVWRTTGAKYKAKNIIELSKMIKFESVLEVGCGDGSILYWLSKWNFSGNLNAIEISESGVEMVKSKDIEHLKEVLIFDGYKIPYENNHFDLVICSHVMEHVEHERLLLREIRRVSKYQIFEVPIDFSFSVDKKLKHYLSYGHINIYTPALFRFLLLSENFGIIKDKCHLYNDEVLHLIFANNRLGYYKLKVRHLILRLFPYLLGIKPSSYVILTEKKDEELSIFQSKK